MSRNRNVIFISSRTLESLIEKLLHSNGCFTTRKSLKAHSICLITEKKKGVWRMKKEIKMPCPVAFISSAGVKDRKIREWNRGPKSQTPFLFRFSLDVSAHKGF